ncbi:MAG TPA: protein-L-isoaspartate(D-aspartate) O-methyltransferase [Rhizomicrobium sp.]|jgi:protein-L-isoaspartate(D-aspartate) O-methyltransferase|nr:protein-L-isoaspartate(D-aspartate) O-methyltransferase [Rhizomicrobium sp.]
MSGSGRTQPDPRAGRLADILRKQGIKDERVLSAIERTPREIFVDQPFDYAAYDNSALPIACGQTISQPYVVAYATQELKVEPNMRVLEVGAGSGYQAAVLSLLCRKVYAIERHRPLLRQAEARFKALKLENIVTRHGDGLKGWPEQAPFDRILLSAAVSGPPLTLIEQLKPGGVLIGPIGTVPNPDETSFPESFSQHLTRIIRTEAGFEQETLIPVMFVPMVTGLPQEPRKADDRSDRKT